MRILFVPFPVAKSHLYLATTMAWSLRAAGHEVRVASTADLAEEIAHVGLTGVTVGEPIATGLAGVNDAEPEAPAPMPPGSPLPQQADHAPNGDPYAELCHSVANFHSHVLPDSVLDGLVGFARSWQPDLVVWDQILPAGAVLARASGAAHARLLWGSDGLEQLRLGAREPGMTPDGAPDPWAEWLGPVLARYGCEYRETDPTGQFTIDTMPPWTWHPEPVVPRVQTRQIAFNGPATVPSWVYDKPERRRICISLGITLGEAGVSQASAADLLEAVADLDVEVIAGFSPEALAAAGPLPPNVRPAGFVPHNALLPSCDAVIHHGGSGTYAAALEHAVPQLVVPSAYWTVKFYGQVEIAASVDRRGTGVYVAADSNALTPATLRSQVLRVLDDPSFRERALEDREALRAVPSPNAVVPEIEALTREHREH